MGSCRTKLPWNWFNNLTRIITAILILNYRLVAFVYSEACRRMWVKQRPCQINRVEHPKTFIERTDDKQSNSRLIAGES